MPNCSRYFVFGAPWITPVYADFPPLSRRFLPPSAPTNFCSVLRLYDVALIWRGLKVCVHQHENRRCLPLSRALSLDTKDTKVSFLASRDPFDRLTCERHRLAFIDVSVYYNRKSPRERARLNKFQRIARTGTFPLASYVILHTEFFSFDMKF